MRAQIFIQNIWNLTPVNYTEFDYILQLPPNKIKKSFTLKCGERKYKTRFLKFTSVYRKFHKNQTMVMCSKLGKNIELFGA